MPVSGGVLIIAAPQTKYIREKSFLMVAHLVGKDLVIRAYTHTHTNKVNARLCVHIFIYCTLVKDHDHDDRTSK